MPELHDLWSNAVMLARDIVMHGIYLVAFYVPFLCISFMMKYDAGTEGDVPKSRKVRNFSLANKDRVWDNETSSEMTYSFVHLVFFQPVRVFLQIVIVTHFLKPYVPEHIFQTQVMALPFWLQSLLILMATDISLYIRHRFVHEFCWPFHAVHHAAPRISWTTADRLHPVDNIIMGTINVAVLHIIGFEMQNIFIAALTYRFLNYFNHSNIQLDYGFPLRYVFVSPNMHRWHHATTPEAFNKNYCIIFSFFDLLFGTFYVPKNQVPSVYGVPYQPEKRVFSAPNYIDDFIYPFKLIAHNWRTRRASEDKGAP